MTAKPWPATRAVYVVRWTRTGGAPAHRFYFLRWYAERFANALLDAGFEVEMYATHATWTPHNPAANPRGTQWHG